MHNITHVQVNSVEYTSPLVNTTILDAYKVFIKLF